MFQSLTPIVRVLLFANVGIYILQQLLGDAVFAPFMLWSPEYGGDQFRPWQIVTYAFLHSSQNYAHIFFNMMALYMFGPDGERLLGAKRFTLYYFACVVGAALAQLLVIAYFMPSPYPTVGASGGIFGLLLLFGMAYPHRRIMLLFPPIPMPAWVFVSVYGVPGAGARRDGHPAGCGALCASGRHGRRVRTDPAVAYPAAALLGPQGYQVRSAPGSPQRSPRRRESVFTSGAIGSDLPCRQPKPCTGSQGHLLLS